MPTTVSPSILKRLMLAKYLLTRGALEHSKRDEVSMAVAVLHFHDCVDLFLDCVVEAVGADTRGVKNLEAIPNKVTEAASKPMARAKVVKTVNALRVPLKHEGVLPNPTAVAPLLGEVAAFLEENAREFLGVELADISLADMVGDRKVREHLREGEQALDSEDYARALREARFAFRALANHRASQMPGVWKPDFEAELVSSYRVPRLTDDSMAQQDFSHMIEEMNKRHKHLVDAVQELRRSLALGIDLAGYERFEYLTPISSRQDKVGEWHDQYGQAPAPLVRTRENVRFCLDFVITAAFRVEAGHPVPGWDSRYTVEVTDDTVPVYTKGAPSVAPTVERNASRGQQFSGARLSPSLLRNGQPYCWRLDPDQDGRTLILPYDGVKIVDD